MNNSKTYDVFISFKDFDENNNHTPSRKLSEDVYHSLLNRGYHPFWSPSSLDGKGGDDFTEIIDKALETSRILVLIIGKPSDIESRWVKHEYETFLGTGKKIVPVFKNMSDDDISRLPSFLKDLQVYDVSDPQDEEKNDDFKYRALIKRVDELMDGYGVDILQRIKGYVSEFLGAMKISDTGFDVKFKEFIERLKAIPPKVKRRYIFGILAALIVIIGSSSFLSWYNRTDQKIIRALKEGNYDTAISLYQSDSNAKDLQRIERSLSGRLEDIRNDFTDLKLDYAIADMELSAIRKMSTSGIDSKIDEVRGYIDTLNESRTAFSAAVAFTEHGDYANAITQFRKVSDKDTVNYEAAKTGLTEAIAKYREVVLNDAEEQANNLDYIAALTTLNNALAIIANDSVLTQRKTEYEAAYTTQLKNDALKQAKDAATENNYTLAIETIRTALSGDNENDPELQAALDNYCGKYANGVIAEADELVSKRDYPGALKKLSDAMKFLPDYQQLKDKYNAVEANKPVSLEAVDAINHSDNWKASRWNDGNPVDPFGNTYTDVSNYCIFSNWYSDSYYREYRLYGEYKTLTGKYAPQSSISESAHGMVQVYADDTLVYTSPEIGRKTDSAGFSVDISGAEYIKVVVEHTGDGAIIVMDLMLWKE